MHSGESLLRSRIGAHPKCIRYLLLQSGTLKLWNSKNPMADKTPVEIPFSQIEYVVSFESPLLDLVGKIGEIIRPFIMKLAQWGFVFEESELNLNAPKPRDHVIIFNRPNTAPPPVMRVAVRWSSLTVTVDQPDWSEADSLMKLCATSLETLQSVAQVKVKTQQIVLNMHIQSKTTPRSELTNVLLTPTARELLEDGEIVGQGLILHRAGGTMLIDNSVPYANGLYVRIMRTFDGSARIEQISETLLKDEQKLWEVLKLEGEL
jgi:hypothetical protein